MKFRKAVALHESIRATLAADPLVVVDAGCAGGIDPTWAGVGDDDLFRFIGFEANAEEYAKLPKAPHTSYFNLALSDHDGEIDFFVHGSNSSVYRRGDREARFGEEYRKARVPCKPLGGLFEAGLFPAPDILKVDVEGHEMPVLKGAGSLLQTELLAVKLEFLFHGLPTRNAFTSIHALMVDSGFQLFGLALSNSPLGGIDGGDALYLKSLEALVSSTRNKVIKAVANACWLGQRDYSRVLVARAAEEGVLTKSEADNLTNWVASRVFLPDLLPHLSAHASQFFFLAAQILAGRRYGSKSAPKANRLVAGGRLMVPAKLLGTRRSESRATRLLESYRAARGSQAGYSKEKMES